MGAQVIEQQEGEALIHLSVKDAHPNLMTFRPLPAAVDSFVICQWDMFSGHQRSELERRHDIDYICPGVNNPISLATGWYVMDERSEGWRRSRAMAPQASLVR